MLGTSRKVNTDRQLRTTGLVYTLLSIKLTLYFVIITDKDVILFVSCNIIYS